MSCDKHKKTIEKYSGSLEELAEDIGNLHYESLTEFLFKLSEKLYNDSSKDVSLNRLQLGDELAGAAEYIKL
jgi:hypothetical protein